METYALVTVEMESDDGEYGWCGIAFQGRRVAAESIGVICFQAWGNADSDNEALFSPGCFFVVSRCSWFDHRLIIFKAFLRSFLATISRSARAQHGVRILFSLRANFLRTFIASLSGHGPQSVSI